MPRLPEITTLDFETEPIEARPHYPPKPVGVSIKLPTERTSRYYAWGHPTGNNCTPAQGKRIVQTVWKTAKNLLGQNMKFDTDVAETWCGVQRRTDALSIHDTLFLIFLHDPHAPTYSLKPSAERILGMAPTEQQELARWLIGNQEQLRAQGLLPADEKITLKNFGKWICLGPGELVGNYADGDVVRTFRLFKKLYPEIVERGMLAAYQREQKLMPIMLDNEREGMRVAMREMERDFKLLTTAVEKADAWLRKTLKTPSLNLDAPEELADALEKTGIVTEWVATATGKRSTSKKNMTADMFNNKKVSQVLGYRDRLTTCLNMYFKNWLRMARETGGTIHTEWNQVRQSRSSAGKDNKGARTGRLSASLFMNVPKDFDDKGDGYIHPAFLDVPALPLMRRYVLPDAADHWFGRRDYNQQELRILAHFENGDLLNAYNDNPYLDTHRFVQLKIADLLGREIPRSPVKMLNFGFIYGQGVPSMAGRLGTGVDEIQELRNAQLKALPGLPDLSKETKARGKRGESIRTWGGREYFCEPPGFNKKYNKHMTYEYKLLNYLIQGSAADCTKEALVRYHEHPKKEGRLIVTVHDEIDISAPKKIFKSEMLLLRECMMSVEFDVPMLSDAEYGPNWASLKDLKEPSPFTKGG